MTPSALTAGHPEHPAIVFLHGVGGDGSSFKAQLEHFAKDHYCLAWHMPGYADSPLIEPYDWPNLANALIALLDAEDLSSATVVGHSIGGMVAQAATALAPERVSALVLSATSPAFGNQDGDFQKQFLAARLGPLDEGKTLEDLAPGIVDSLIGQAAVAGARDDAIACMSAVPEVSYRAAMTAITTFDARADLAQIHCPTLVIAGEQDTNAPAKMMARMAEKIDGAVFQQIPDVGHLSYMEQSDAFNHCLAHFLQDCYQDRTP